MTRLRCRLTIPSRATHINQIVTGFILLERQGVLALELREAPDKVGRFPSPACLEARIDDRIVAGYDLLDGYNCDPARLERYINTVDIYFKRSYDPNRHRAPSHSGKVYPLGLNYPVTTQHPFFRGRSDGSVSGRLRSMVKRAIRREEPDTVECFEAVPRRVAEPRVLFVTGAWDPSEARDEATREDRERINRTRAECIRALRREFGHRFAGGMVPSRYASRTFPDIVIDGSQTDRRVFLQLVKQNDICIATTGLHGSTGWKLGEYVAAARGIVSEELRYVVPGDFAPGRNYLPFAIPDTCVERVLDLAGDPDRLYAMQASNHDYYRRYLRPDRLVINTILLALGEDADHDVEELFDPPTNEAAV